MTDKAPLPNRAPLTGEELRGWLRAVNAFTRAIDADIHDAAFGGEDTRDIIKGLVARLQAWLDSLAPA